MMSRAPLLVLLLATSINGSFSSSNATCNSTECSTDGESSNVYTVQTLIAAFLENQSQVTVNASNKVLNSINNFILSAKLDLTNTIFLVYGAYFQAYRNIFDNFYAYLIAAVDTRNTCQLYDLFQRMLYNVYMSVYFVNTGGAVNTTQFLQCSYEYFVETNAQFVNASYSGFATSFNRLVLFLRALRVSSVVLESVASTPLTKPCIASLAKISNCSTCLGTSEGAAPCEGLCENILRGCLVDLAELVGPFQDYLNTMVDFKNNLLLSYNPWNQIVLVTNTIFKFLTLVRHMDTTALTIKCNPGAGKRDVPLFNTITRRAAVTQVTPSSVINSSTLQILSIPQQLTSLSELVCSSVHAVGGKGTCWNGVHLGRYHHIVVGPGGKSQQSSNPEVVFCPSSGTLYQRQASLLKMVTQDLKLSLGVVTCLPDDEDCYGSTSITSSSCDDLYSLAAVPNITRRAAPSHYDQGGSGSGSGSGAEPMDFSVCDEVSISSANSSVPPPTTECYDPVGVEAAPSSEVTITHYSLAFYICIVFVL